VNRSELIALLQQRQPHLPPQAVETAVKDLVNLMAETLSTGGRIEIRGFGSFSVRLREPRLGRNPKTGASVEMNARYVPHFKPGKELRERVKESVAGDSKG
jgi:integration host factor subunit beta